MIQDAGINDFIYINYKIFGRNLPDRIFVWKFIAIEFKNFFSNILKGNFNSMVELLFNQIKRLIDPVELENNDPDYRNGTKNNCYSYLVAFHGIKLLKSLELGWNDLASRRRLVRWRLAKSGVRLSTNQAFNPKQIL